MTNSTLSHLYSLRRHVLHALLGYIPIAAIFIYFSNSLFYFFSQPLLKQLPPESTLISTTIVAPFLTPLKLSLILAALACLPWFLYQIWAFIAPGLFPHEKKATRSLTFASLCLFYSGIAFAYFLPLPLALQFFIHAAPAGVTVLTEINAYFDFAISLFFAFGMAFQIPLAVISAVRSGLISKTKLQSARPYVIIGAFTLGMLLTPPDVFSQTLLALPLWGLYEVGLKLC